MSEAYVIMSEATHNKVIHFCIFSGGQTSGQTSGLDAWEKQCQLKQIVSAILGEL